jgi:hypothetical protein
MRLGTRCLRNADDVALMTMSTYLGVGRWWNWLLEAKYSWLSPDLDCSRSTLVNFSQNGTHLVYDVSLLRE